MSARGPFSHSKWDGTPKKRFPTQAKAEAVAAQMLARGAMGVPIVYSCDCGGWHVGSQQHRSPV